MTDDLVAARHRNLSRLHAVLRRQITQWDQDQRWDPDGVGLREIAGQIDRLRAGALDLTVLELADVCRAMGWSRAAFYAELGLVDGDYIGLFEYNGGQIVDIRSNDWHR